MRKFVGFLFALAAVVALPRLAAAQDGDAPRPPAGARMFERLDANHDGVVELSEIPESAPQPIKDALTKAAKDKDGKLTSDDVQQALESLRRERGNRPPREADRERPDGPRPEGRSMRGPGGPRGPRGPEADKPADGEKRPPREARDEPRGERPRGPAALADQRRGGDREAGPKAIFARLDKNHDGQLSEEEFAAGVEHLQQRMRQAGERRGGPPQGERGQRNRRWQGERGPEGLAATHGERGQRGGRPGGPMMGERDMRGRGGEFWAQRGPGMRGRGPEMYGRGPGSMSGGREFAARGGRGGPGRGPMMAGRGPHGMGPQGFGPRGMGPQQFAGRGMGRHGMGPQGFGPRGMGPQQFAGRGMERHGMGPQGIGPRGMGPSPILAQRAPWASREGFGGRGMQGPRSAQAGRGPGAWGAGGERMGGDGFRPPREMFRRADENRDGKIGMDEMPEARRAQFARFLNRFDADDDDALSPRELRAGFEQHRGRPGDGPGMGPGFGRGPGRGEGPGRGPRGGGMGPGDGPRRGPGPDGPPAPAEAP